MLIEAIAPTGLTGIYTHPNPGTALLSVYNQTLAELAKFPESSVYRQSVENVTKQRKQIVEEGGVNEVMENKIGAGLIEEVLIQAGEELALTKKMLEWKPYVKFLIISEMTILFYFCMSDSNSTKMGTFRRAAS